MQAVVHVGYTRENFLHRVERYDLILDVASTLSLSDCKRVLTPTGTYWRVGHDQHGKASGKVFGSIPQMIGLMLRSLVDPHVPTLAFNTPPKGAVMERLRELLATGAITPIIARTFPLGEVAAAIRCLQEGRTQGRIVIVPCET
jgi:NADPH:quinone reductase-like Zn-dependent oxidoreductase